VALSPYSIRRMAIPPDRQLTTDWEEVDRGSQTQSSIVFDQRFDSQSNGRGFLRKFAGEELAVVSTAVQSSDSDLLAAEVMKENGVDISDKDPYKCTIAQVRKEDRSALDLL
jgi:hypothetical protein